MKFQLDYDITVDVDTKTKAGTIQSNLVEQFRDESEDRGTIQAVQDDSAAGASADAVEAMILAQACAGIDIGSPAYRESLKAAVEAIANNLE